MRYAICHISIQSFSMEITKTPLAKLLKIPNILVLLSCLLFIFYLRDYNIINK